MAPLSFTIVTPSYNQASFLEATIDSVLSQGHPNTEYLVIDGGSTDGSLEIIKKHSKHLKYWCCEPDAGQTDAIRKGFARATGEIMNWLNSDDLLAPGALDLISEMARRAPGASIFAAATETFVDGRGLTNTSKSVPRNLDLESLLFRSGRPIDRHQPGIFFRRALYVSAGGVDPRFHYCMDLDLHARLLEHGGNVEYDNRTVAYFRSHAASKTQGVGPHVSRTVREYISVAESVGARTSLRPDHRGHLNALVGGAAGSVGRRQWTEARECIELALDIGGVRGILSTVGAASRRRLLRGLGLGGPAHE